MKFDTKSNGCVSTGMSVITSNHLEVRVCKNFSFRSDKSARIHYTSLLNLAKPDFANFPYIFGRTVNVTFTQSSEISLRDEILGVIH